MPKSTKRPRTIDAPPRRQSPMRAGQVRTAPRERVRQEFLRVLNDPQSSKMLRTMDASGVLSTIIPDLEACRRTAVRFYGAGGVLRHSLETVENLEWLLGEIERVSAGAKGAWGLDLGVWSALHAYAQSRIGGFPRHAWLKFGALLHDLGKPATAKVIRGRLRFWKHQDVGAELAQRVLQGLRCSRQETQRVRSWVQQHMRLGQLAAAGAPSEKAIARYFRQIGDDSLGAILVSLADHYCYMPRAKRGKAKDPVERVAIQMWAWACAPTKAVPVRLVNGHQLMKKFKLKPSPVIGELLELVSDAQVEGKVRTKKEAIEFVEHHLRSEA